MANYPLLRPPQRHADEESAGSTGADAASVSRPFLDARFYWLTKSPVFAPSDPSRKAHERNPSGEVFEPEPSASAHNGVFWQEGDFWRIRYEGTCIAVRPLKGLAYLQYLLLRPEEKFHVSQLSGLGEQRWSELVGTGSGAQDFPHQELRGDADSGNILDVRAQREYRARLVDLRAELDEALHWADFARADSIRREIDFITSQLTRAFGRGGRARKMSDPMERVRKAVTNRIHDAIEHIEKLDPALGRHLHNAIRTGFFCWYSPESPVLWTSLPPPSFGNPR
jgi:hypothetical protein